jgi:hypothetical protein
VIDNIDSPFNACSLKRDCQGWRDMAKARWEALRLQCRETDMLRLDLAAAERGHDAAHAACVEYDAKVERMREALRRICTETENGTDMRAVWEIARDALSESWKDAPVREDGAL